MASTLISILFISTISLGAASAYAQSPAEVGGIGLSRTMLSAIQSYEKGDDIHAMDQFMEILTKGDPAERSRANEYINLITHRMNTLGGAAGNPAVKPAAAPAAPARPKEASPAPASTPAPAPVVAEKSRRDNEMPEANKALMRKEIRARLRNAVEKSLSALRAIEGVRVVARENGDPEAIGIPSDILFQEGVSFQRDVTKILDPLTKLVFALGATSTVILPEGTAIGDAKVLDMRRTMGISSHLFNAGVAPPRVRVNLLNTQVDIPKGLRDFKGVVIIFVYNQPLNLAAESAVGEEQGPPISLGVYPASFRPSRGQGVIIEFSVSDPPAGLMSWKFSLLQPARDGSELSPLQEVIGGGAVFHQIFWNGKQNYFGQDLPPGRYECVLTAIDGKNRRRTLHRWIQIPDDGTANEKLLADQSAEAPAPAGNPAAERQTHALPRAAAAPVADFAGEEKPLVSGLKAGAPRARVQLVARANKTKKHRPALKRPVRGKKAASVGRWELAFNSGTYQLTPSAEKLLAEASEQIAASPQKNLRIIGYPDVAGADDGNLAGQRAKMVAGLLVNRYQVDSKRIFIDPVASDAGAKVDLELVGGQ